MASRLSSLLTLRINVLRIILLADLVKDQQEVLKNGDKGNLS